MDFVTSLSGPSLLSAILFIIFFCFLVLLAYVV